MDATKRPNNWWTRECGGRDVVAIALPLVISTGFFSLMLFVDRMFLLWHSTDEMAAAMPAGMLHWTMICFPLGVTAYVNTFVAQYHGARRPDRIGLVMWQGVRIGLYTMPLFLCAIPLAPTIFNLAGHELDVRWHEVVYFQVLAFGAGPAVMSGALSSFFTGRGATRVVMYVNVVSALLNITLDYAWIFGRFGFSEMGIEGAAWATVVSQWFKIVVYLCLLHGKTIRTAYGIVAGRRFDAWLMKRLFVYGGPNGLQIFVESVAFTVVLLKMGQLGKAAMAATTLAFNVNAIAFIPLIGVGIAVSTLVGQQLTRGRPDLAARATWTALWLAVGYTGTFAVVYVTVPDVLLLGHRAGADPGQFAAIRDTAVVLLRFVAAYCLFDAMQVIFAGAIKGAGDTWFVLGNAVVVSLTAVSIGWLGAKLGGGGLIWWWFVITGWTCVMGLIYMARFIQGRWRHMQVIEREYVEPHGAGQPGSVEPVVATQHARSISAENETAGS